MRKLKEIDVAGKRVLLRVDFNVPLEDGKIADDTKLKACLPTISYLMENKAKVILCSHLGSPKGKRDPQLSLRPVAQRLGQLLGKGVNFAPECLGEEVERMVFALKPGEVLLLENLRFYPGEEKNDPDFAYALSRLAELYVNDAFAVCHRAHASVEAITQFLPAAPGFLLEKEIEVLSYLLYNPAHPFALVLGGVKIADKIGALENLLDKVDLVLIGGAIFITFLKSLGYSIGKSPYEPGMLSLCQRITQQKKDALLFPIDVLVARRVEDGEKGWVVNVGQIPEDCLVVDIGPETIELFSEKLRGCQTIFWNGPMGIVEVPQFAWGTIKLVEAVSQSKAVAVVGGGSTASFFSKPGIADKITHISTGGGALLKFMEGKKLPGIAALERSYEVSRQ